MVQLREKDLPGRPLLDLAMKIRQAIEGNALLIVNERVDVALLSGADGVHLGEEALSPSEARSLVGDGMIIGRSVHDDEGALKAQQEDADYLIAGSVFPTRSHPGQSPQGLRLVQRLASQAAHPLSWHRRHQRRKSRRRHPRRGVGGGRHQRHPWHRRSRKKRPVG